MALLVTGDRSAFYRCKFLGYQDTLLDDHGAHYFNNCFIEGASDYICGDGKSLYQNCHINAIPQQNGAITAQKRSSPSEDTGFIFLNCRITGRGLMFLGRPWGSYSRVVFAYTQIDDIIYPQGWDNWGEPYTDNTVFYAQYKCYGPGANTTRRAPWSLNLTPAQAEPFLSKRFIGGNMWMRKLPYLMRMVTKLIHRKG